MHSVSKNIVCNYIMYMFLVLAIMHSQLYSLALTGALYSFELHPQSGNLNTRWLLFVLDNLTN